MITKICPHCGKEGDDLLRKVQEFFNESDELGKGSIDLENQIDEYFRWKKVQTPLTPGVWPYRNPIFKVKGG